MNIIELISKCGTTTESIIASIQECKNINERNSNGQTALIYCGWHFSNPNYIMIDYLYSADLEKIIARLIEKGADLNAQDNQGNTCLHYLARYEYKEPLICRLINAGSNVLLTNKYGITVFSRFYQYSDVIQTCIARNGLLKFVPKDKLSNIVLFMDNQIQTQKDQMEQIQYQTYPGEEFWKLVKEEFPNVSDFELFKTCKKVLA